MMKETEYLINVKLMAAIRIKATSKKEARFRLTALLDCADANFGAFENGDPITGEISPLTAASAFKVTATDELE